jgi:type IV secretory pathway VirJ component
MRLAPRLDRRRPPTKAATLATEGTGPPRPDARGCSSHSARAKNRSQVDHTPGSPRTRALRAVAENDRSHSAASEIQANTALPDDTTVSVRAYAAHGQARHQTSCLLVDVPSNASMRDLITFSLTLLQEFEVDTQSAISIPLLRYLTWFSWAGARYSQD